jgi:hypothetical protein
LKGYFYPLHIPKGEFFVLEGDEKEYTDSHYSNVFTIWDKIFGTYHKNVAISQLKWGLKEYKEDKDQTVISQLMLPFKQKCTGSVSVTLNRRTESVNSSNTM